MLVVGLTSLTLALIQGPQWELDSAPTLTMFAVGVVVLAWFVHLERRDAVPLLELELLRVRDFVGGVIVKLGVNFALAAFLFFMSLYLQEVLGYTPEQAGWGLLPLTAPFVAFVPVGSRLGERFGARMPILVGLAIAIASFVLVARVGTHMHYVAVLPSILLLGIGAGLVVTPMNAAPINAIPQRQHGEAAAILQTTTGLGSVLGIALGGALFQEMHERRLTDFLGRRSISESTQHELSGVLVHSPPAQRALDRFDTETASTIVRGIREAFVFGVSTTMWLSAAVLAAGMVAALALLRPMPSS
jgi:predicted MFS family arabinose efflux permease